MFHHRSLIAFAAAALTLALLAHGGTVSAGSPSLTRLRLTVFGGASDDSPSDIAAAPDGSVYVAGDTISNPFDGHPIQSNDGYLVKFGTGGKRIWSRIIGGSNFDFLTDVAVGKDGSVYVTGQTASPELNGVPNPHPRAAFVLKYDRKGTLAWTRLLSGSGDDTATSVAVGKDGSIYVAGYTLSPKLAGQTVKGGADIFVARYRADGKLIRVTLIGGPGIDLDAAVTADSSNGSVYVAGVKDAAFGQAAGAGNAIAFFSRLDRKMDVVWSKNIGGRDAVRIRALAANGGSLFVGGVDAGGIFSGHPTRGAALPTGFVARYNSDGNRTAARTFSAGFNDSIDGISVRTDETLCLVGTSQGSAEFTDEKIIVAELPASLQGGASASIDGGDIERGMGAAAAGNNCWVAGETFSPRLAGRVNHGGTDLVVAKFR